MFLTQQISKKELRIILGYKPGKWSKELSTLEPELLMISPNYKKLSSLLTPKEVKFILDQLVGISEQEFNLMVREKRAKILGNSDL